jgi:hypothetical protein
MKTWEIKITATDEMSAAQQLSKLIEGFKIASEHGLPMDSYFADAKEKYEEIKCDLVSVESLISFVHDGVLHTVFAKPHSDAFYVITRGKMTGNYVHIFDIIK